MVVLPHCVGTESMDEKEIGFVGFVGFGDPAVDEGGAFMEVQGR